MIWIATLCLLLIAAWLFFNALNERRWVQAHSHDESVASDKGLLPAFSSMTGTGSYAEDGKVSINQENSRFARSVAKVQEKTGKLGEKFFESKAAAARIADGEERPASARDENTLFGRAVARIGEKVEQVDQRLEEKMKAASSQASGSADGSGGSDEGLFARASRKVAAKSDEIGQRVANHAKNASLGFGDGRSASEEDGMFGKMVQKVSGGIEKVEAKVESRIASSRRTDDEGGGDIVSRVASRVGDTVNQLDEKFVKASKSAVGKMDETLDKVSKNTNSDPEKG